MRFTDEVGSKLGHKGDVRCITPSLTHILMLAYKDSGLSGLSFGSES